MENLEKTNPAQTWLKVRLSAAFQLGNGHTIVVRFDVASAVGAKRIPFTRDTVWENWSRAMLGSDEDAPAWAVKVGEAAQGADKLAQMINENLGNQAEAIIEHCTISFSVLDALKEKRFRSARDLLVQLASNLQSYEPQATDVGWGEWVVNCTDYLKNGEK